MSFTVFTFFILLLFPFPVTIILIVKHWVQVCCMKSIKKFNQTQLMKLIKNKTSGQFLGFGILRIGLASFALGSLKKIHDYNRCAVGFLTILVLHFYFYSSIPLSHSRL